jgi:hypothetical protein
MDADGEKEVALFTQIAFFACIRVHLRLFPVFLPVPQSVKSPDNAKHNLMAVEA